MSPRPTKSVYVTSILAALALFATACSGGEQSAGSVGPEAEKIKVLASTNVWGSVLSVVGGDQVEVTSVIRDPSADPHSYEATPADALAAKAAKLTLGNGGGYDDFFTKLAEQASGARKLVAYEIAATGEENEHIWYSLVGVQKVAEQIATALGELRPASKQAFADSAGAFKVKIDELRGKVSQIGVTRPGSSVVATEPLGYYLLKDARVTDVTPAEFSKAVEEETDIPAAAVDQVKQLIAGKRVRAVVNNAQTVTPITEQLVVGARTAGVSVVEMTETLPAGFTGYLEWMRKQVDVLALALSS